MVDEELKTQGDRLRYAAKRAKFETASDLARAIGMPEGTVRSAMNGTRPLTSDTAKRLGTFLKVAPGWLLYGGPRGLEGLSTEDPTSLPTTEELDVFVKETQDDAGQAIPPPENVESRTGDPLRDASEHEEVKRREFGARLAQALAHKGLSYRDAAVELGWPPMLIEHLTAGALSGLSDKQFRRFADVTGVSAQWLKWGGLGEPVNPLAREAYDAVMRRHRYNDRSDQSDLEQLPAPGPPRLPERSAEQIAEAIISRIMEPEFPPVPIFIARENAEIGWRIDEGTVVGHTHRPSLLEEAMGAYAVEVWNAEMEPALKQGCLAFVHPLRATVRGDDVVVRLLNGGALIRRLEGKSDVHWEFSRHSDQQIQKIGIADVAAVELIVETTRVR